MLDAAVDTVLNSGYVHGTPSPERRRELERDQLDALIRRELNLIGGIDNGLEPPIDDAEDRRRAVEHRLGATAYARGLAAEGLTPTAHLRMLAETMLAERAYRRFVTDRAVVTDDEVRAAYGARPDRWIEPESVHLGHILLELSPSAPPGAVEGRAAEAEGIVRDIEAGEPFAVMAERHSDDMYRIKGGDLGWVHRGRLLPELETAVWGAAPGAVVGPIRTSEGFHIARVLARRDARRMPFDEVAPMARQLMEKERLERVEDEWYGGLRRRHPVEVFDPALHDPGPP